MEYKIRPGIVKTKICDNNFLIPTRSASDYCKTIQPLSIIWSASWEMLERGDTIDRIVEIHHMLTKKPKEELKKNVENYFQKLCDLGFLERLQEDPVKDAKKEQ